MILGLWHVSFTVSNLDRSVAWYTKVLGLEYVRGQVQDNEYTRQLVGFPIRPSRYPATILSLSSTSNRKDRRSLWRRIPQAWDTGGLWWMTFRPRWTG